MLIPLVPTALYPLILTYLVNCDEGPYTAAWAVAQLQAVGYRSEAGNLYFYATNVPVQLRSFYDTVRYCSNANFFEKIGE